MSAEAQNTEIQDESSQQGLPEKIVADLDAGNHETITTILEDTHPSIVSNLIESLPQERSDALLEALDSDYRNLHYRLSQFSQTGFTLYYYCNYSS